jgi:cardiolipin synthase (CMP-forming)
MPRSNPDLGARSRYRGIVESPHVESPGIESQPDGGRLATIPNLLSALRLASVPVFIGLFVSGHEEAAFILYAVGAWTDFFDGYIARRTGQVTEIGKLLDPLADRLFIVALAVALVATEALPLWLALVIVIRDVVVLTAFPLLERRGMERIQVNFTGKSATAGLLFGLTLLAYGETSWPGGAIVHDIGIAITAVSAILYWAAAALYGREISAWWRIRRDNGGAIS